MRYFCYFLLRCLSSLLSRRYQQVELHSFTVRPRGRQDVDPTTTTLSRRDSAEATQLQPPLAPPSGCAATTAEEEAAEEEERGRRKEALGWRSGRLCLL